MKQEKYDIDAMINLTQDAALTTLQAGIETRKIADRCAQDAANSAFAANEAVHNIAKNYWSNLNQLQNTWFEFCAETTERAIKTPMRFDLSWQKEFFEFGKEMLNKTQKTFETAAAQAK